MRLPLHLFMLCLLAVVTVTSGGRSGGGSRSSSSSGGSRGGSSSWGGSSSSRGTSYSSGYGSHSSGSGSSNFGWHSSATNPKPKPTNTHHTSSHLLPVSTGARNPIKPTTRPQIYNRNTPRPIVQPKPTAKVQQTHVSNTHAAPGRHNTTSGGGGSHHNTGRYNTTGGVGGSLHRPGGNVQQQHVTNQHTPKHNTTAGSHNPFAPSAPPLPGSGSNPHAPSAPPLPAPEPNKPGWHPGVTNDAAQKQHVTNTHSTYPGQAPPPYPGHAPPPYPGQAPPPYPGQAPPSYPGHAPSTYPGQTPHYPGHVPPTYPGQVHPSYPGQVQPHYPGQAPSPYPVQSGGPVYQYPAVPPPPPGFSPYGATYYKDRSSIRGSDVVAGLALWELMRHNQRQVQQVHHHHYPGPEPSYHDTMRQRYTTRTGAHDNVLEMTHYVTADAQGQIFSSRGNMTCLAVYNARSVAAWHKKQVAEYRLQNDTASENFTVVPGRVVHREPVSITCCGTDRGKVDLDLLTNGKHPHVNCVNHAGHIPINKLTFIKTTKVVKPTPAGPWHAVQLQDFNTSTPTPLATFPPGWNETSTETPLAPFPANVTQNIATNTTTPTPLATFSNSTNPTVVPTASSVDLSQTFSPLGVNNTAAVDVTQVFNSTTTESPVVVTNNPSDLIIG